MLRRHPAWWKAASWLASSVTEGDHRKVSVETYLKGMQHTLSHLTGQLIEPLHLSDDRLRYLCHYGLRRVHEAHRTRSASARACRPAHQAAMMASPRTPMEISKESV